MSAIACLPLLRASAFVPRLGLRRGAPPQHRVEPGVAQELLFAGGFGVRSNPRCPSKLARYAEPGRRSQSLRQRQLHVEFITMSEVIEDDVGEASRRAPRRQETAV